jgi:hypothetical protein
MVCQELDCRHSEMQVFGLGVRSPQGQAINDPTSAGPHALQRRVRRCCFAYRPPSPDERIRALFLYPGLRVTG